MTVQDIPEESVPNFRNSAIVHGFFGILEFALILITIIIYTSNVVLATVNVIIISFLIVVLYYAIISKNPYYYVSCLGLMVLTIFPTAISMIIYIGSTSWSYEPIKIFGIIALIMVVFYIFILMLEISHNKYISYFHRKYGGLRQSILIASFYSTKEFDKFNKGKQFWHDRNPEDIQKVKEELKKFEKRFKKKFLIWIQIIAVVAFNITFAISLVL